MPYESRLALGLVPYTAGEQPKDRKIIKLNTNENPYPPSPEVEKALQGKIETLRLYPDTDATELREAIAEHFSVSPEQVFCGNGSDEVLAFAFAAFFAGKDVFSPEISYSFYPVYASLFGANLIQIPMHPDFTVDVKGLMREGPVVLANPNAPTSLALAVEEIRTLAAHALEKEEILLVDEAYADFAKECAVPLLKEFDNLLIVRTFSKSHSLAGLRVGYALGSPRLIQALRCVRDSFNSYPTDRLAQAAAAASMRDWNYTRDQLQKVIRARDKSKERLRAAGIEVLESQTNFLFVHADPTDALWVQKALREKGILVRYFASEKLKPYLRVSIGTESEMEIVTDLLIELIQKK